MAWPAAATRAIFIENAAFQPQRSALGASEAAQKRLLKAALDQQWQDIEEYSAEFFEVFQAASARQQLTRACVREALAEMQTGFIAFDACLLHYASLINDAYDRWYILGCSLIAVLPCKCHGNSMADCRGCGLAGT
jgi:hypothetical protein